MTTRYRWEKGQEFIEIEGCISTNSNSNVLIVNTNVPGGVKGLPDPLRNQVPVSEERDLYSEVKRWADAKGFKEVALADN